MTLFLHEQIRVLELENKRMRTALEIIPAARIRLLADYLDFIDAFRNIKNDEVQVDLRDMADHSERALSEKEKP